jgi:hypothetical protein
MGKTAVGTDGENLYIESFELVILDGNCRQFRRSNEGKVARVKA